MAGQRGEKRKDQTQQSHSASGGRPPSSSSTATTTSRASTSAPSNQVRRGPRPPNQQIKETTRAARTTSESSLGDDPGGWACVVCCQRVPGPSRRELYALGPCDHMICYECSTKMRVLCTQNECPICRQDIPKVVFTSNRKLKYAQVDFEVYKLMNQAHKIVFESPDAEVAYQELLNHRCQLCKSRSFNTLKELDSHLRREHEVHLCDLCAEHLRIFSHERKYYTRKELVRHRKHGDAEDTSHRGHPLCQFCDVRYVDDEDLHRHLRRDHYYCHFCDPLGLEQFYADYDQLRGHFQNDHHMCTMGACAQERFTSVFRSDIDLQAHRLQVHAVTKTDAKAARILSLDFSLKPRANGRESGPQISASVHHQPFRQLPGQRRVVPPTLNEAEGPAENSSDVEPLLGATAAQEVPRPEDFPSLAAPAAASSASLATAGAARPLTYASNATRFKDHTQKVPQNVSSKAVKGTGTVSSYGSRAGAVGTFHARTEEDFPSLSGLGGPLSHNPALQRRELKQYSNLSSLAATVAAVPPTAARKSNVSTINSIAEFTAMAGQRAPVKSGPKPGFAAEEFPCLPISTKSKKKKKTAPVTATAPTPVTPVAATSNKTLASAVSALNSNSPKSRGREEVSSSPSPTLSMATDDARPLIPSNDNDNFPGLSSISKTLTAVKPPPGLGSAISKVAKATSGGRPPPGYEKVNGKKAPPPPPGLAAIADMSLNSNPKTPPSSMDVNGNGSSTTSGSEVGASSTPGEVFGLFKEPSNFEKRNQSLVAEISETLKLDQSRFSAFKKISNEFRKGATRADDYYKKCVELFGKVGFGKVFLELIVLLPDIKKQNELLAAHEKFVKYSKGAIPKGSNASSREANNGQNSKVWNLKSSTAGDWNQELLVCPTCQQVLAKKDGAEHVAAHRT